VGKFIDLTGQKFGRLTVVEISHSNRNGYYWKCVCECGNTRVVRGSKLRAGKTISCGCFKKDFLSILKPSFVHGKTGTIIYHTWQGMMKRCYDINDKHYPDYGGRGIKVCKRWRISFENFYSDMGDKPKGMTLDRIDNDGDYSPENCRWATIKQQARNRRSNKKFLFDGEMRCIKEISDIVNISYETLRRRLSSFGWGVDKAISTPVRRRACFQ